jgi:hypothetical protein
MARSYLKKEDKMKNSANKILLVSLLLLIPLFVEGKSTEKKSLIQEIKDKITKEVEKQEEKKSDKDESRIKEVKEKVVKEKKKEEHKIKEKVKVKKKEKEKDKYKVKKKTKHDYGRDDKNKHGHDYVHDHYKKPHKKTYRRYKDKYYSDTYVIYDDVYYDDYRTDVIYDDYTYIDESELLSPNPLIVYKNPRRIIYLNSSVEGAYLGKDIEDTYGVTGKISANLFLLHFNCFYQSIFSKDETLTLYSVNGGLALSAGNVTLTPFIGAFYIEPLEEARLSYGADLQIFLPYNYNLDFYSLNSSYGSLDFYNFSASLNYEFHRLNFGLGFNYNNYAGISFSGPLAKFSFWL